MFKSKEWRIYLLMLMVFLASGAILIRLFFLQIIQYDLYNTLAQDQYQFFQQLFPNRGEVYIQDLKSRQIVPLAINKEFKQVYAVPQIIADQEKEDLSEVLSNLLSLDKEIIFNRISKIDDPYEPLKHKVDDQIAEQIEALAVEGIKLSPEISRYYPGNFLASHLIGFVGIKDDKKIGQYGLEEYYEDKIKGRLGSLVGEKDTIGRWIPTANQEIQPAQDGPTLILTIDQNIQFKAEKELKKVIEKYQAATGVIIVLEPSTGAVRAMASFPNYDPNHYSTVEDINVFLNPAIQSVFEPGSVFKAFTMAAGLDSGQVSAQGTFEDTGTVALPGGVIKNVNDKVYGIQTMTQILEQSINTGAVYVQNQTGRETFRDYVQSFGFGQPTGIDLSGEVGGNISNLYTNRPINFATASFGQGIAVTPIQLISAFAAIANQGKLTRPYIVEKIVYADEEEIITQPKEIRQVISSQTAFELAKMLTAVVDSGHSGQAQVKGYNIAGKTGTAEVPKEDEAGYSDETIHTFIGFAPAFDPKFVILVKIEKPIGVRWAATSVTPTFRKIAEYLLNYFEIPPQ